MVAGDLPPRADVVIVGGGLIGCLSALALARRGLAVVVLERGAFGRHAASRAAAGMLQIEAHASLPLRRLCATSRDRYPLLVEALEAESGLSIGLKRTGGLSIAFDDASEATVRHELALHEEIGMAARWLDGPAIRGLEPSLTASHAGRPSRGR